MRPELRRLLAAALLLLVAGRAAADADAPFLWQVKGKQVTHYLLGSIHLLPKDTQGLPNGIIDAYDAADRLVFETDLGALSSPGSTLALLASARSARGLRAQLDRPTYARLRARMAELDMPRSLCESYKPWFCALTLEVFAFQKAGFRGDHGLDQQLYNYAREDGKDIEWFEAPSRHLALFTDMDETLGRQFLASALDGDASATDEARATYEAWRSGDSQVIEGLVRQMRQHYPALYRRLLAARNRAWMPKIRRLLDGEHPSLIVVGAAHWFGPDGLIARLRAAGYQPLPYTVAEPELLTTRSPRPLLAAAGGAAQP